MLSEICILQKVVYKVSMADTNRRINIRFNKLDVILKQKLYLYPHFSPFDREIFVIFSTLIGCHLKCINQITLSLTSNATILSSV